MRAESTHACKTQQRLAGERAENTHYFRSLSPRPLPCLECCCCFSRPPLCFFLSLPSLVFVVIDVVCCCYLSRVCCVLGWQLAHASLLLPALSLSHPLRSLSPFSAHSRSLTLCTIYRVLCSLSPSAPLFLKALRSLLFPHSLTHSRPILRSIFALFFDCLHSLLCPHSLAPLSHTLSHSRHIFALILGFFFDCLHSLPFKHSFTRMFLSLYLSL